MKIDVIALSCVSSHKTNNYSFFLEIKTRQFLVKKPKVCKKNYATINEWWEESERKMRTKRERFGFDSLNSTHDNNLRVVRRVSFRRRCFVCARRHQQINGINLKIRRKSVAHIQWIMCFRVKFNLPAANSNECTLIHSDNSIFNVSNRLFISVSVYFLIQLCQFKSVVICLCFDQRSNVSASFKSNIHKCQSLTYCLKPALKNMSLIAHRSDWAAWKWVSITRTHTFWIWIRFRICVCVCDRHNEWDLINKWERSIKWISSSDLFTRGLCYNIFIVMWQIGTNIYSYMIDLNKFTRQIDHTINFELDMWP